MNAKQIILIAAILVLTAGQIGFLSASSASDYFRSKASGDWGSTGTWQSSPNGVSWENATLTPTTAANTVTIQNGHTVTVAAAISIDQTVVASGGQLNVSSGITLTIANGTGTDLTVNGTLRNNAGTITTTGTLAFGSGGKYQHNYTTAIGIIPTATWDANSTCEIVGYTSASGTQTGLGQSFGHFVWSCTSQTGAISANNALTTINGNLKISATNTGSFVLGNATSTLALGGDLIIEGGTFNMNNRSSGTGTQNVTINLKGKFTMSGGTLTKTATDARGYGDINFAGNSTQLLAKTGGTISNAIRFTVNNGATLEFDAASTVLDGSSATFTAASGSTLVIKHAGGIASSGATGCVQTETRTFNSGANYTYTGSATGQITGTGLPATVNNLVFDNSVGTTLSSAHTVSGNCTINTGRSMSTGNNAMTFQGNFINNGTFNGGSSAITISGTAATQSIGSFSTTGTVSMTKTSGTATLTGNVNGGALTINGTNGTLNLGSGLTHTFSGT